MTLTCRCAVFFSFAAEPHADQDADNPGLTIDDRVDGGKARMAEEEAREAERVFESMSPDAQKTKRGKQARRKAVLKRGNADHLRKENMDLQAQSEPCAGGCGGLVGPVHKCPTCKRNIHPHCGRVLGEGHGHGVMCPSCDDAKMKTPQRRNTRESPQRRNTRESGTISRRVPMRLCKAFASASGSALASGGDSETQTEPDTAVASVVEDSDDGGGKPRAKDSVADDSDNGGGKPRAKDNQTGEEENEFKPTISMEDRVALEDPEYYLLDETKIPEDGTALDTFPSRGNPPRRHRFEGRLLDVPIKYWSEYGNFWQESDYEPRELRELNPEVALKRGVLVCKVVAKQRMGYDVAPFSDHKPYPEVTFVPIRDVLR